MQMPQVHQPQSGLSLLILNQPSFSTYGNTRVPIRPRTGTSRTTTTTRKFKGGILRVNAKASSNRTKFATSTEQTVAIKAVVSVKVIGGALSDISLTRGLDDITDLLGRSLILQLVSSEVHPNQDGSEPQRVKGYARKTGEDSDEAKYECTFQVPPSFGEVGAVLVENEHHKEMFVNNIVIDSFPNDPVTFTCESWVCAKLDDTEARIFFTNKSYLPSETPSGLKNLREIELENHRGNGEGERKRPDRIYDYDKYNDLGEPDKGDGRPVLGGPDHPYPRRCRTGCGPTETDPLSEKRTPATYVPRDESFSDVKGLTFSVKTVRSAFKAIIPILQTTLVDPDLGFPHFGKIDSLFDDGIEIPEKQGIFKALLPRLIKAVVEGREALVLFEPPELINRDKFSWFRDEEFSRQTLAGLNPYSIELVKEWPLKSKLDPKVYGPSESAITTEIIEREIKGFMTLEEAMEKKKLFILDYHDLLLPYVQKVRELEDSTLYGSRTLFFLNEDSTLRPIAIELTRPVIDGNPQWKHVYTPSWDATNSWLWKFAKSHVTAHDAGFHQLVSHWLRTHCCVEPYIIAAHRQLSAMHPIFRLLHPHFRYTMEINALAREYLINGNGIIETCFAPGKYSSELSSAAYDKLWRFDMEALPADLIRRGLAVEDPSAKHGLRLTIEDYPFANDGLILWDAIKSWVTDYVNHYYHDDKSIENDTELQAWWTEVRTKGHADKKDEPWWPVLDTADSLIQTLSTIIWVPSGHHAAVNFGQYHFAGYFPNRPTIVRTNMPNEDPSKENFKNFLAKPEAALLECFPSQIQATIVMVVLDVLSSHSPDEEYIGDTLEPS
ncbi:hypothetical protein IFM89_021954 [Coptis chinensis]|uniref:Lipoxygenase n=1 Tax=Coptis chinensis TaxID=261450 RepID=A0A835HEI1_9MAGN|nr:hypothetical protein IFM89_021954 [Coptis chinensis]